jgi:hypothetical protein
MSDRQKCNVCSDFMPLDGTTANPWSGLVMKGSPVRVRASALRKALQTAPAGCGPRGRRAGARRAPRRPGNRRTYAAAAAGRRGPSRRRRRYVGDDLIGDAVRRFVASGRSTATSRSDPDRSGCGCRRVLGIAGLTWAFRRLAANAAAHVTLTEIAEAAHPFLVRRGRPGSAPRRPACGRLLRSADTSASESGRYSSRIGARP